MERLQRKRPRLKQYDYSQSGACFVTTNVSGGRCLLSQIAVGRGLAPAEPKLTAVGEIVRLQILEIPKRYPFVSVDNYVIMPNHVHLILLFQEDAAGACPRPTPEQGVRTRSCPTLMQVVGAFKSLSARRCNQVLGTPGEPLWQTSFYESVLQSEQAYQNAWTYIDTNPARWAEDEYFVR